jgi:hypothetical protein
MPRLHAAGFGIASQVIATTRLTLSTMMLVGMAAWTARYALFAFGDNRSLVWMLYAGILLHVLWLIDLPTRRRKSASSRQKTSLRNDVPPLHWPAWDAHSALSH